MHEKQVQDKQAFFEKNLTAPKGAERKKQWIHMKEILYHWHMKPVTVSLLK
jgi:hypothetical protein